MYTTGRSRSLDSLKPIPAVPGNTLVLTLDAKLQETMEKSYG